MKKFGLVRNTSYALAGLWDAFRHEASFRLEVLALMAGHVFITLLALPLTAKALLSLSLLLPLIAELLNTAIERTVDLVTEEYHDLARRAKDVGSAAVFLSVLLTGGTWVWVLVIYRQSLFVGP